ncbi:hypothetical protein AMAG_04091 [Allomyces macrogynus ATCC 38327]|uniref:B30.2/SPRY domain-containing protein n=1 Tax=Allomyces macrogynus (strain ATCC 38327) TaxID=578462 RepID=A0A0L0S856_ALLM3|nr:hypothetical protein AMAG_04091 [Allomyces macrogynus ATCC 38327]|eukprot:KNE58524.1 hypothetical protein AMAG_04091 [Allomyces macrogynus ATCC 38327]
MAATNDLQVTAQGSLSTPVHVAPEFDNDRAESYLRANPPLPPLVTADQIEQMKSPSAWQFSATGLPASQATVGDNLISFFQVLAPFAQSQDATVFTTLPVPWLPDNVATIAVGDKAIMPPRRVLYFEISVVAMNPQTTIAVGLTTTPYPSYRLPGWHTWSLGYHSDDGRLFACDSEHGQSYGKPFRAGDVVGVGIDTTRRAVFFTRNGVRLPDVPPETRPIPAPELAVHPAVGADGPCIVHYNFGTTEPFKWAEANDGYYGYCWEPLPTYSTTARPAAATTLAASPSTAPFFAPGTMAMPTPTMVMPTPTPIASTLPCSPPIGTVASPAGPFVISDQAAVPSLARPPMIPTGQAMSMPEPTAPSMPPTAASPPALR